MTPLKVLPALAAAATAAALLAGCAPSPAIDGNVATTLADVAQRVRTDAAAGNYATALSQLSALEQETRSAARAGTMSGDRSTQVLGFITQVRTDLESLQAAQSTPAAAPTPTDEPTPTPSPTKARGKDKKTQAPAAPSEDN